MLVSAGYAGLAALYNIFLIAEVVALRFKLNIALGDGTREQVIELLGKFKENPDIIHDSKAVAPFESRNYRLTRAVRAHGNYLESAPMLVILVALAELNGMALWAVHTIFIVFFATRLMHRHALRSDAVAAGPFRKIGTASFLLLVVVLSLWNVYGGFIQPLISK
ncbi:membrane-associated, eicosanoid/glutathione metabolism protein [Entophlyctis helioformis]|nr:membrane-associated, eicosanoid/glutathione metabolism protein [Entophlyctis helioformis]